jgi:hypothetical protein
MSPESPSLTCPGCGAPVSTVICTYCGTLTSKVENLDSERRALDEFHHLLARETDKEKQGALLRHGFIPENAPNIIEAGLRCATYTGGWKSSSGEPAASALTRLRSLIIRLKIAPETPETRRALQEFETILENQRAIDRKALLAGIGFILVPTALVIAIVMGLIYWVIYLLKL